MLVFPVTYWPDGVPHSQMWDVPEITTCPIMLHCVPCSLILFARFSLSFLDVNFLHQNAPNIKLHPVSVHIIIFMFWFSFVHNIK